MPDDPLKDVEMGLFGMFESLWGGLKNLGQRFGNLFSGKGFNTNEGVMRNLIAKVFNGEITSEDELQQNVGDNSFLSEKIKHVVKNAFEIANNKTMPEDVKRLALSMTPSEYGQQVFDPETKELVCLGSKMAPIYADKQNKIACGDFAFSSDLEELIKMGQENPETLKNPAIKKAYEEALVRKERFSAITEYLKSTHISKVVTTNVGILCYVESHYLYKVNAEGYQGSYEDFYRKAVSEASVGAFSGGEVKDLATGSMPNFVRDDVKVYST